MENLQQTTAETLRRDLHDFMSREIFSRRPLASVVRQINRGFDVFCVIRVYDRNGRFLGKFEGMHPNSGYHAEEGAVRSLQRNTRVMQRAQGGHIIVVVTQDPCAQRCSPLLRRLAERLGITTEQFEAYVPTRQSRRGTPRQVSGRTSVNTGQGRVPYVFRAVNVFSFGVSLVSPFVSEAINRRITERRLEATGYDPVTPALRFADEPWLVRFGRAITGTDYRGTAELDVEIWLLRVKERAYATPIGNDLVITWEWPHGYDEFLQQLKVTHTETEYTRANGATWTAGHPHQFVYEPIFGDPIRGPTAPSLRDILDPTKTLDEVRQILEGPGYYPWIRNLPGVVA